MDFVIQEFQTSILITAMWLFEIKILRISKEYAADTVTDIKRTLHNENFFWQISKYYPGAVRHQSADTNHNYDYPHLSSTPLFRLRKTHYTFQLPVFFFMLLLLFFCQLCPRLGNFKWVFLILKLSQYGELMQWAQLFPRYSCKNWYSNWFLHFRKNYGHQNWVTIKSHNSLITWSCKITGQTKTVISLYHDAYDHPNWQGCDMSLSHP